MISAIAHENTMSVRPYSRVSWHSSDQQFFPAETGSDTRESDLNQQQLYIELWAQRHRLLQQREQILNGWESSIYQHQTWHVDMANQLAEISGETVARAAIDGLRQTHGRLLEDYRAHLTHLDAMRQMQQNLRNTEREIEAQERQLLASAGQEAHDESWQHRFSDEPSDSGDLFSRSRSILQSSRSQSPDNVELVDQYYSHIADVRFELERIDVLADDRDGELQELRASRGSFVNTQYTEEDWSTFHRQWQIDVSETRARLETVMSIAESTLQSCEQGNLISRIDQETINGQFVVFNERLQDMLDDQEVNTRLLCLRLTRVYRLGNPHVQMWLDAGYETGADSDIEVRSAAHPRPRPESRLGASNAYLARAFYQRPANFVQRQQPIPWLIRGGYHDLRQDTVPVRRSEPSLSTLFRAAPP